MSQEDREREREFACCQERGQGEQRQSAVLRLKQPFPSCTGVGVGFRHSEDEPKILFCSHSITSMGRYSTGDHEKAPPPHTHPHTHPKMSTPNHHLQGINFALRITLEG